MYYLDRPLKKNPDGTILMEKSGINHSRAVEIGKRYEQVKQKYEKAMSERNGLS